MVVKLKTRPGGGQWRRSFSAPGGGPWRPRVNLRQIPEDEKTLRHANDGSPSTSLAIQDQPALGSSPVERREEAINFAGVAVGKLPIENPIVAVRRGRRRFHRNEIWKSVDAPSVAGQMDLFGTKVVAPSVGPQQTALTHDGTGSLLAQRSWARTAVGMSKATAAAHPSSMTTSPIPLPVFPPFRRANHLPL